MLSSRATGSVSIGNLSAFDVIGSKAREIAGDDTVAIGNEKSCLKSKTSSPSSFEPCSTDNHSTGGYDFFSVRCDQIITPYSFLLLVLLPFEIG